MGTHLFKDVEKPQLLFQVSHSGTGSLLLASSDKTHIGNAL